MTLDISYPECAIFSTEHLRCTLVLDQPQITIRVMRAGTDGTK